MQKNHQVVHILIGDSAGGSARMVFCDLGHQVIVFPTNFSVGPLTNIHTEEGLNKRFQWLKDAFQDHQRNYLDSYKDGIITAINEVEQIPSHHQVIIWTCENASEQFSLRFILGLLPQQQALDIYELNTYFAIQKVYEHRMEIRRTGEISSKQMAHFYNKQFYNRLSFNKIQQLIEEGHHFLQSSATLHSWKNGELIHEAETKEDKFIIECARKLHKEQKTFGYIKAARVIGTVFGECSEDVSDDWIEYRIRKLIEQGVFSYQGHLQELRKYEVKLNEW